MKRTLILMRHAKTEDQKPDQRDFDRELLSRGRDDAAAMAIKLKQLLEAPQRLLSSPARRTTETSEIVRSVFSLPAGFITFEQRLYHAPAHILLFEVMATPAQVESLMIIGHNPGISDFAYDCSRDTAAGFSTASIAVFEFNGEWMDFESAPKKLRYFLRP